MLSRNNPLVRALTTRTMRQSVLSKNVKARDSKAVGEHAHAEHADHGDHGHHGYPYPGDLIPFSCYNGVPSTKRKVAVALQLGVPVTVFFSLPIIGFIYQQSKL